jgi:hypothetical protein
MQTDFYINLWRSHFSSVAHYSFNFYGAGASIFTVV